MESVNNYIHAVFEESKERDVSAPRNEKPPDLRLKTVSGTGDIGMRFTSPMTFPDDIMDSIATGRRLLND